MLTIGAAAGATVRTINIVLVRPGVGSGMDPTTQPDASVTYNGAAIRIKLSDSEML